MAYRVILVDEANGVELDTENIDMSSIFSIADVNDISVRNDSVKSVVFKGSKTNNDAFGNLSISNKVTDSGIANKIGFNYNPLIVVPAFVYEDSVLVFKGTLRVVNVVIEKGKIQAYNTVITGGLIDFKNALQDKYLHDLDFSDLSHQYKLTIIKNSWATNTQRIDDDGNFITVPFEKGSGYVYPHIDYGVTFFQPSANSYIDNWNVYNYRPAIYLKEYFDRIFSQAEVSGFSYEIKADNDFINKFNSAIIPNADEKIRFNLEGWNLVYAKSLIVIDNSLDAVHRPKYSAKLLHFHNDPLPPAGTITTPFKKVGTYDNIFDVTRTITSDCAAFVNFPIVKNLNSYPVTIHLQVVERKVTAANNSPIDSNWEIVQESKFDLNANEIKNNYTRTLSIGEREWKQNTQIALRVLHDRPDGNDLGLNPYYIGNQNVQYTISQNELAFPSSDSTPFKAELLIDDGTNADTLIPRAPENIKQLDFLKSIALQWNLFAYTETSNPRHIIFQKRDDYYAFCLPQNVSNFALDWTRKLDFNSKITIKSNIDIPKSYLFSYKEDSDFINTEYKKKYGELYGSFRFTDAFGITAEKKLSLIFSPTPIAEYNSTQRIYPLLHKDSYVERKPTKTNIRLLYYNGLQNCISYNICKDELATDRTWTTTILDTLTQYPNCSTFYFSNNIPVEDLNFGLSFEYFFPLTQNYLDAISSYQAYYSNQVTELTNPNVSFCECEMLLNEVDIANLDLRVPIYLDMGMYGHGYFKVLEIEYENKNVTSKVLLQKIYLGTES